MVAEKQKSSARFRRVGHGKGNGQPYLVRVFRKPQNGVEVKRGLGQEVASSFFKRLSIFLSSNILNPLSRMRV